MLFLLIEDDAFKRELIETEIIRLYPEAQILNGQSVREAVRLVKLQMYDFVVLDIALPSHDTRPGGAQPLSQPSGGVEVLLELAFEQRTDRVVIVTQYPEIEYDGVLHSLSAAKTLFRDELSVDVHAIVHFNAADNEWKDRFASAMAT